MNSNLGPGNGKKIEEESKGKGVEERLELLNRIDQWLDTPLAVLGLVWIALIIVELTVPLPPEWALRALVFDILIWIAFLTEFIVEFTIAPDKLRYLQTHFLVAISVVLPFFRVFHVLTIVAALRGLSLLGVLIGVNRITRAAEEFFARSRLQYVIFFDAAIVLLSAAATYYFERNVEGANIQTFTDSLYWAATLITTINISFEPVTFEGRIIGFFVRIVALATFGYVTGSIASFLVHTERTGEEIQGQSGAQDGETKERDEIARLSGEIGAMREAIERLEGQINQRDS